VFPVLKNLLKAQEIVVESADEALSALSRAEQTGADFADCLIEAAGARLGCAVTYTFDQKAARLLGMEQPPGDGRPAPAEATSSTR
jgi:predicted nucleic-acid-binding protein